MVLSLYDKVRYYAGLPFLAQSRAAAHQFLKQCRQAGQVQRDLLLSRVARHAASQFGRDHHFATIRSEADFRRQVPIGGYERHEPYIDRSATARRAHCSVLTPTC